MEKGKFKKALIISALVLVVTLISITYFFAINNYSLIGNFLTELTDIIMPFIIGVVLAYLLKGTCNFFERTLLKMMSKIKWLSPKTKATIANLLSVFISYVVWAAAILLLAGILVSQVIDSISQFIHDLQYEYIDGVVGWVLNLANDNGFVADLIGSKNMETLNKLLLVSPDEKLKELITILSQNEIISEQLGSFLQGGNFDAMGLVNQIFNGAVNFVSTIVTTVIGIIISIFLLLGRKTLSRKSVLMLHCLFKKDRVVNAIVDEAKLADRMFAGFIEGKIIGSTIVGLVYYIALELMGVPYAPLVAVVCGVTNIIPIFGPFIGSIPCGIIILADDYTKVIPFVAFVLFYQLIDGYIIDPHIVGGNIKLPSVWVVFAVILFGGLFGFPGLLVGVPTFAVIYDIVGKICAYSLKKNGKYNLLIEFKREQADLDGEKKKKRKKKAGKNSSENNEEMSTEDLHIIADSVADHVTDKVADSIVDAVAESMAEAIAAAIAENIPENVDKEVADSVTEKITEKVTGSVSEKVADSVSEMVVEALIAKQDEDATTSNETNE